MGITETSLAAATLCSKQPEIQRQPARSRFAMVLVRICFFGIPFLGACSSSSDSELGDGSGGNTAGPGAGGPGHSSSTGFGSVSSGGPQGKGCRKADFLFVIDNSGSMGAHQENLASSFPGFIKTIQETLPDDDYRIMVVDSDAQDICDDICTGGAPFCAIANDVNKCSQLGIAQGCDATLGAGRRNDFNKKPCGPLDGGRYMTIQQPDLATTFSCVAQVGTYGQGDEKPLGALFAAIGGSAEATACNAEFLRKDAILVVTILTDAPPNTATEQTMGTPKQWSDTVVAAKAGNANAITMIGFVSDGDVSGGLCSGETGDARHGAPKMREWVSLFPHHVLGSVCEPNYTALFATAVKAVDDTCEEFVPPS